MRHFKRIIVASITTLVALATTAQAQHDVHAFLSEKGVSFVENHAASFLPSTIEPEPYTKAVACMDFVQRDTVVNLNLNRLDIQMPAADEIRVALDVSIDVQGELYVDDLYACLGEVTCQDSMSLQGAAAVIDLNVEIVNGQPRVSIRDVDIDLNSDTFEFSLDGCGVTGSALSSVVGFAQDWLLYFAEIQLASMAEENLAPQLEGLLAGLSMDDSYVSASIESLSFPNNGILVAAQGGIKRKYEAAECIRAYDDGGPSTETGDSVPNLQDASASDLSVAVNIGLINQGLYAVWHRGLMCLSSGHLAELGVELDLTHAATLLPGFPAGSAIDMDLTFTKYPKVEGSISSDAELAVVIEGLQIDLHGDRPDGTRNTLHAELDVRAAARLALDPSTNAIAVQLLDATITRMEIRDERSATEDGYDVARIQQMVHDAILPKIIDGLGTIPVSGAVFATESFAVMLRSMHTSSAYLSVGADLFAIPQNDQEAPDTKILSAPTTVVNPTNARLVLAGSDSEIPEELLQYIITINGVESPPTFLRETTIGQSGSSETYEVQVAAVDLAGNIDPTPATASITVDGTVPVIVVSGPRTRSADEGPVEVRWTMSDDRSEASTLSVRVDVFDLEDPSDALSARLMDSQELAPGTTSTVVELDNVGGVYRVEVHAIDEAGNDAQSSLLLGIASSGGCSAGGQGTSGPLLLLLAMAFAFFGQRRKRY